MGQWKDRMRRHGDANETERRRQFERMTHDRAVELLEGLHRHPPYAPPPPDPDEGPESGRKLSLGRLLRVKR